MDSIPQRYTLNLTLNRDSIPQRYTLTINRDNIPPRYTLKLPTTTLSRIFALHYLKLEVGSLVMALINWLKTLFLEIVEEQLCL